MKTFLLFCTLFLIVPQQTILEFPQEFTTANPATEKIECLINC